MGLNFASRRSLAIGRAFFLAGLVCFLLLGLALVLQHGFDMKPCAWCSLQRLLYLIAGLLFLLASRLVMARNMRLGWAATLSGLATLMCAAGLWAALYQHLVAAASASCDLTFADRVMMFVNLDKLLPWLFKANASCSQANIPLLGVPFAIWSACAFAGLLLVSLFGTFRLLRNRR